MSPPKKSVASAERRRQVTTLLVEWTDGDRAAMDELMPLVYDELRRLARAQMARERTGHLLQATALVNEAFMRLVDIRQIRWQGRAHFLAMAARLMRRILVEHARSQAYQKRGAGAPHVTFDELLVGPGAGAGDLVALDDALAALAVEHDRKARVVELRYFGGLSVEETAGILEVSAETVMRDWKFARNWLFRELARRPSRPGPP